MVKSFIEFKKQRDFGLVLTDTFSFLRSEFKPLSKLVLNITGPYFFTYLILLSLYNYIAGESLDFSIDGPVNNNIDFIYIVTYILYWVSLTVTFVFLCGTVFYYVKSYIENKGSVNQNEVYRNTYKNFWLLFGIGILKLITLSFALMLCILPILYAFVPMSIVFSIFVFRPRSSVMTSYSDSYNLVNLDFWTTWGSYIVFWLIYIAIVAVLNIPLFIYTFIKTGILSGEIDPTNLNGFTQDPLIIIFSVIQGFAQIFLYIIPLVGGVMLYYNLNEKKNFTGTYERIGSIGKTED